MTPEEKAAALAEAKSRGLPDGWRVELDVRLLPVTIITWNPIQAPNSTLDSLLLLFLDSSQFRRQ